MRLLSAFLVGLGTNAVALVVAAALLDGFGIGKVTFPVLIVVFTIISMVVTLLVDSIVRRHAQAMIAGIGLISSFLALLVTDMITDKLTIEGAWAWIVGTLLVWLASLVVRPFLRGWSDRRAVRRRA
jgi:MFS family permease